MPKPGSKLRIRLIDPNITVGSGQTVESKTINNRLAYIWLSLVKKLEYATGSGPTYQKKILRFENSMEPTVYEKSRRKIKVRRVTHKAHGLYPEDPSDIFEDEDKDYEFIDVEDILEFTIGEGSGPGYQQTTFVMHNPDNIAESRADAITVDADGRKTHRVRIHHQQWFATWVGTPVEDENMPAPHWFGIDRTTDYSPDGLHTVALSQVWIDVERIDEFTTTTGSGPTYQKTHWRVIWDDLDQSGRNRDPFKDARLEKFLFGDNLDQPPDANGDPIGYMGDEDAQGNPIQVLVTTDINMPATGRGWRLDPFQTIVNVHWGYASEFIPHTLYFPWGPNGWGAGVRSLPLEYFTHPDGLGSRVPYGTGLYEYNGYDEAAVRAAAAANAIDDLPHPPISPADYRDFRTLDTTIAVLDPSPWQRTDMHIAVSYYVPPY